MRAFQSPIDQCSLPGGWLVEVRVFRLHLKEDEQKLFVAAIADQEAATAAVRKTLGGLHCVVEAKCRLSARALQRLRAHPGNVVPMRPERTRRPRRHGLAKIR